MRLVFDLEANDLYEGATVIHCIVLKDISLSKSKSFGFHGKHLVDGLALLEEADELIGHNIIDYDLRLIKKLYPDFKPKGLILDTYLLSSLLNPDRKGGHSLGQYGEELGIKKPEHEDWSQFSPEMLHRCTEDVHINHKVYDKLMTEAYEDVRGLEYHKIFTNSLQ